MSRRLVATLAALAMLCASPALASADYQFTTIADSADGFEPSAFGCAALNNTGAVAFRTASAETGEDVILRGRGRALTTIATESEGFDFLGRNPSIEDFGRVSFAATLEDGGEAILRGSGGALTEVARTDPGPFAFFVFDTSISERAEVAFSAELDDFDEGLFVGGRTVYLAGSSDFAGNLAGPAINLLGQVAFTETLDNDVDGVFRADRLGRLTRFVTIADDTGELDSFFGDPSLNNLGGVAFHAFLDDGEMAIFAGSGGALRRIADTRGEIAFLDFEPSLNDFGRVAYLASFDDGSQAIFAGSERVVGTGDLVAGSAVINLGLCREAFNDLGQVAFTAQLEDGRTLVVRAGRG